jgi:hypothetical protein
MQGCGNFEVLARRNEEKGQKKIKSEECKKLNSWLATARPSEELAKKSGDR